LAFRCSTVFEGNPKLEFEANPESRKQRHRCKAICCSGADNSTSWMGDQEQATAKLSPAPQTHPFAEIPHVISLSDPDFLRLPPRLRRQRGRRVSSSLPGGPEAASCSGCGARSKARGVPARRGAGGARGRLASGRSDRGSADGSNAPTEGMPTSGEKPHLRFHWFAPFSLTMSCNGP